jgi:Protein of unknown function (DUF3667)
MSTASDVPIETPAKDTATPIRVKKGPRACENCKTELLGETCYHCGQPVKGLVRQFSSIMGDFLDTVLNIDTRVFRTLGPLIYKPGFLTYEYFSGRRIRYVSPVRLFFFLAVIAFLFAQWSMPDDITNDKGDVVQINSDKNDAITQAKTVAEVEALRKEAMAELAEASKETEGVPMMGIALEKAAAKINESADARIKALIAAAPAASNAEKIAAAENQDDFEINFGAAKPEQANSSKSQDKDKEPGGVSFNGERWDPVKNPIKFDLLPDAANAWLNSLAQKAENNTKVINDNPAVILKAVLGILPMTLFLMLPIFALLLKVMFFFKRRLYMEHLIVALHSHAFLMLAMIITIIFGDIAGWASNYSWLSGAANIIATLLLVWIPIYLFIMQKRVYRQGWIMTSLKYFLIGNIYFIMLTFAFTFAFIFKLVWL